MDVVLVTQCHSVVQARALLAASSEEIVYLRDRAMPSVLLKSELSHEGDRCVHVQRSRMLWPMCTRQPVTSHMKSCSVLIVTRWQELWNTGLCEVADHLPVGVLS